MRLSGVIAPVLTPFNDDGSVAIDLLNDHASLVLAQGADFISPFGTTGEASSLTVAERKNVLEALVHLIEPSKIVPGTGLCSMKETAELTRHAICCQVGAVMVLPPYFYSQPSDDGLFRYFSELIIDLKDVAPKVLLYNIPQNTGVKLGPSLTSRLRQTFPDVVVGYKDSSGDLSNSLQLLRSAPDLAVFPSSEAHLIEAMCEGASGCISATCNVNARMIKALYLYVKGGDFLAARRLAPRIISIRERLQERGLIYTLKAMKYLYTGDHRWLNTRAPLVNIRSIDASYNSDLLKDCTWSTHHI